MRGKKCLILLLTGLLLLATTTAALAATAEEKRQETREKVEATLDKLYQQQPEAEAALANAAGYAVFVNTGIKAGIFGSSHGRGLAYSNVTGEEVFMRMKEYQAGFGLGVKEYAFIFAFVTQTAWDDFTSGDWSFGGQADAAASDGMAGGAFEGAVHAGDNIWVYQMTTKGLALELAFKGSNYYRDKELNGE